MTVMNCNFLIRVQNEKRGAVTHIVEKWLEFIQDKWQQ